MNRFMGRVATELEQAAINWVICERCGAGRGEDCITDGGNPAMQVHQPRMAGILIAGAIGYNRGHREAVQFYLRGGDHHEFQA